MATEDQLAPAPSNGKDAKAAAEAPGDSAAKPKKNRVQRHRDVKSLPADLQALVVQLLREGATYEDTVAAVNEASEEHKVTLHAVQNFFRSNIGLQQERIRYRIGVVQALKKALGNPQSVQSQLAEAVMLTGLMGLRKKEAEFNVKGALRQLSETGNRRMREHALRMKSKRAGVDLEIAQARLEMERARLDLIRHQVIELKQTVERAGKKGQLDQDAIQKIQEIYGLVTSSSGTAPNSRAQA
jgi:hypothetical protein